MSAARNPADSGYGAHQFALRIGLCQRRALKIGVCKCMSLVVTSRLIEVAVVSLWLVVHAPPLDKHKNPTPFSQGTLYVTEPGRLRENGMTNAGAFNNKRLN